MKKLDQAKVERIMNYCKNVIDAQKSAAVKHSPEDQALLDRIGQLNDKLLHTVNQNDLD